MFGNAGETNKHRYVIATQSQELRQKLRSIPGVPVVHMNRSVMILEPPSDATLRVKALVRILLVFARMAQLNETGRVLGRRKGFASLCTRSSYAPNGGTRGASKEKEGPEGS